MANVLNVNLQSLNQDMTFAAKGGSGHWIMLDTKVENGGNEAATTPMELLLKSLGGCTGMDTLAILKKKRTPFSYLEINITGERAEDHPKVFTKIHVKFILHSNGGDKVLNNLERAVQLSHDKYCSVAAMLKNTVEITNECEVVEV